MDILAHAVYGATICSRTGLAGGIGGAPAAPRAFVRDWTVWAAAAFGVLPDMASIGVSFTHALIRGDAPSFHGLPPYVFFLYHCTHSLVIAGLCVTLLWRCIRPLAVPALAWPVHIIMDSLSHGDGRWQTLPLYPLSNWHFHGLNWWQTPGLMLAYWGLLPVLWIGVYVWRRHSRRLHGS